MKATYERKLDDGGMTELRVFIPTEAKPLMKVPAPKRDGYIVIEHPEIATVSIYIDGGRNTTIHEDKDELKYWLNGRNKTWGQGMSFWRDLKEAGYV